MPPAACLVHTWPLFPHLATSPHLSTSPHLPTGLYLPTCPHLPTLPTPAHLSTPAHPSTSAHSVHTCPPIYTCPSIHTCPPAHPCPACPHLPTASTPAHPELMLSSHTQDGRSPLHDSDHHLCSTLQFSPRRLCVFLLKLIPRCLIFFIAVMNSFFPNWLLQYRAMLFISFHLKN